MQRAASDALFVDAQENKSKYAARRRDMARRARNKAAAGLARRVSDSKAARTERGAVPKSRSRAQRLPTAVGVSVNLPCIVSSMEEKEGGFVCGGLPVTMIDTAAYMC